MAGFRAGMYLIMYRGYAQALRGLHRGRDPDRRAQDLIALAGVALLDPRAVISQVRPDDRRVVRRVLRGLPARGRLLRSADDPDAVHAFLTRLGEPPQ